MLNAEPSTTPSVPNVIIGVTPSPSSVGEIAQPVSDSLRPDSMRADSSAAVQLELPVTPSTPPVRDTLAAPAMPAEMEDREPASEQRVRVADTIADEPKDEPNEPQKENLHDTIIDAQKIEIVKPAEAKKSRFDDTLVDGSPPRIEEPAKSEKPNFERTLPFGSPPSLTDAQPEAKAEARAEAKALPAAPVQDEETIPPAGDLATSVAEPIAEQFFSEGDLARHETTDDDLDSITNAKAQRKSDPDVVQRRAKLSRYVTWAVGISAVLCLIAGVRTAFTSKTIASANAAHAAKTEAVVPKASPPPVVAAAPKPAETAAAPAPAPVETAVPVVTGDVKEEKAKVKAALDKNKVADAIEAGERAVAIDETDSEAWLLLGASYHQKGNLKEAQRAYRACLEKGTKDKFQRECRMFAR